MAKNYSYKEIKISDLLLDNENPRFASSALVKGNASTINQESIIAHLLQYGDIIELAQRINSVEKLHGSELIACYPLEDKFIVLEGNRRICACKLLLDRSMIPDNYKATYPFVTENTKKNIEVVQVCIYQDRQSVQSYLSDRHITGVKKWSALEKNNYYMNLFQYYGSIAEVKKNTNDSEGKIKTSIKNYQFFMDVFRILRTNHSDIAIEELNYLPMVERFMGLLVSDDPEVGLNLQFDETTLQYSSMDIGKDLYNNILMLIGEAFLLRKESKYCEDGQLSKVISPEIKNMDLQKDLILKDERIPGLLKLIKQYKALDIKNTENSNSDFDDIGTDEDNESKKGTSVSEGPLYKGQHEDDQDEATEDENDKYIPQTRFRPSRKNRKEKLMFTKDEASKFKINGGSDYEEKIKEIIHDLATLSVYKHPCACAMLYRSLLEIGTKFVYERYPSIISSIYDENDLVKNMRNLNNNVLFVGNQTKDIQKIKDAIKAVLTSTNIVNILNLYIHYSNPVDEQLLLSSWNTMKFYIAACLNK